MWRNPVKGLMPSRRVAPPFPILALSQIPLQGESAPEHLGNDSRIQGLAPEQPEWTHDPPLMPARIVIKLSYKYYLMENMS